MLAGAGRWRASHRSKSWASVGRGEDALRLRGGFGNQGGPDPAIGDFAGDISFESVDLERGVDPYEHDGLSLIHI